MANRYQCAWSGAGEGASALVDLQNSTARSLYFIQNKQEALKATHREMTHLDLYLRNNSNSSNTSHLYLKKVD